MAGGGLARGGVGRLVHEHAPADQQERRAPRDAQIQPRLPSIRELVHRFVTLDAIRRRAR